MDLKIRKSKETEDYFNLALKLRDLSEQNQQFDFIIILILKLIILMNVLCFS